MKLTLEHEENQHIVTIESKGLENIDEVMQLLVKPALLAMGYHPDSVKPYFEEENLK